MTAETIQHPRGTSPVIGSLRRFPWLATFTLTAFMIWTLAPAIWLLLGSLKTASEIFRFTLFPQTPSLRAYRDVFASDGFTTFLTNSIVLAAASTVFTVIVASLAGYGFARFAFKWRHALLLLVVVPRLIPQISLITPLFELLRSFNLLDTRLGLVLTYSALNVPFATWLMAGFIGSIPVDLEEAAATDGASFWQRMTRVVMPLALPGLLMAATLTFVVSWNEFPFVLAFTFSSEMRTLPYALFLLRDTIGIPDWPLMNAFAVSTVLPLIVLYIIFQRYIVRGLVQGAVK
jgi:ABC-type glycerol-3-phosphate transport system permease component